MSILFAAESSILPMETDKHSFYYNPDNPLTPTVHDIVHSDYSSDPHPGCTLPNFNPLTGNVIKVSVTAKTEFQ